MEYSGSLFAASAAPGADDGGERRRDGSAAERAIVVGSVREEYEWMFRHCPGFKPGVQMLQQIDGKPYDVLAWENDRGEQRTVYFDISAFFGKEFSE